MSKIELHRKAVLHALAHMADARRAASEREVALSMLAISLNLDACAILQRSANEFVVRCASHGLPSLVGLTVGGVIFEPANRNRFVTLCTPMTAGDPFCRQLLSAGFGRAIVELREGTDLAILGVLSQSSTSSPTHEETVASVLPVASAIASGWTFSNHDLPAAERAVLLAFAQGNTPQDIATQRGTSVRTIRNQLDSARVRLNAKTNAHAVALALSGRFIDETVVLNHK